MRFIRQPRQSRRKSFQLLQRERPDLVARIAMQRKLNRAIHDLPRKRLPFELVHAVFAAWFFEA